MGLGIKVRRLGRRLGLGERRHSEQGGVLYSPPASSSSQQVICYLMLGLESLSFSKNRVEALI